MRVINAFYSFTEVIEDGAYFGFRTQRDKLRLYLVDERSYLGGVDAYLL